MSRLSNVQLPGLIVARDEQIRDGVTGQTSLRLGTSANSALVTDFSTRSSSSAGVRRNGSRVVVSLNLSEIVDHLLGLCPLSGGIVGGPDGTLLTLHHSSVVAVSADDILGVHLVRVTNHGEQTAGLLLAVDRPVGVELLVTAVLRVDLGKHEKLDIRRVALELVGVGINQVVDLVLIEGQTKSLVRLLQSSTRVILVALQKLDSLQRRRRELGKHSLEVRRFGAQRLGHSVVQRVRVRDTLGRNGAIERNGKEHAALDTLDIVTQTTDLSDTGGLGAPGRDGTRSRGDVEQKSVGIV